MTIQSNNDDDLGDLLKEGYAAPPPRDGFVDSLHTSMCRALRSQKDSQGETERPEGAGLCLRAVAHRLRLRWRLAAAVAVGAVAMMIGLSSLFDGEDTASSARRGWAPADQGVERMRGATPKGGAPVAPTPDKYGSKTRNDLRQGAIEGREDPGFAQGKLQLGKTIPLQLKMGTTERGGLAEVPSIMFRKDDGRLLAVLRVRTASHPKGKWQVTVQLLAEGGRELRSVAAVFENSGTMKGVPRKEEMPITFDFGADGDLSGATGFGVRIDLAAEDAAITHGSGG